jgi:carbonic anhydrase
MKKLVRGILNFRKNVRPGALENFAQLALGQKPDAIMFACSDSRVAPNVFASTDPGDLFVVRNVGNIVPPNLAINRQSAIESVAGAALEFSTGVFGVSNIIVCGHSECGAMRAIYEQSASKVGPNITEWLKNGESNLSASADIEFDKNLSDINKLSQLNVLRQLEHLLTYPDVSTRVDAGRLRVHGWWFDIGNAEVLVFDRSKKRFIVLDDESAKSLLE